ncbi:MAG TPA: sigma-70 family RNA polymerase sigma factor [Chthonomonadaceae bacterium]|nr:sigma-70 family RNA polymerase sigma factor [Chthonomonadaceae bacterium]
MDIPITLRSFLRMDQSAEQHWLPAARRGERWALEQLYHAYQAQIYSFCYRLLRCADDAEDATQTTFTSAFRALPDFRGDSSLKTWLYRIAVNEATASLRRRRRVGAPIDEEAPVPDGAGSVVERIAVREAMARMKPEQRVVLGLRYWEAMSYAEIAEVLNLSLPKVKMRLHRAREAFRKQYEAER